MTEPIRYTIGPDTNDNIDNIEVLETKPIEELKPIQDNTNIQEESKGIYNGKVSILDRYAQNLTEREYITDPSIGRKNK